jgi:ataxin-3
MQSLVGWSIFLVRGKFPRDCPVSSSETSNAYEQWFTPDDAQRITKSMATTHNASHEKETESDNEN